jgi:hypothetical protein
MAMQKASVREALRKRWPERRTVGTRAWGTVPSSNTRSIQKKKIKKYFF